MRWRSDDLVDELIAQNAARPRPGMEKPDFEVLARVGQSRWTETLEAQLRQRPGTNSGASKTGDAQGDSEIHYQP